MLLPGLMELAHCYMHDFHFLPVLCGDLNTGQSPGKACNMLSST